jgi:hypothetical protein
MFASSGFNAKRPQTVPEREFGTGGRGGVPAALEEAVGYRRAEFTPAAQVETDGVRENPVLK